MSGRPGQASGKPKPTAVKRLESRRPGRDQWGEPIRVDEIQPSGDPKYQGLPQPPSGMTARAKKTWDFILQCMANTGLFTVIDGRQLAYYCELDARFWELRKAGEFMSAAEISQLRQFSAMFGLDPSSRARPNFPGQPEAPKDGLTLLRERKQEGA